jgi:dihydropyrimidinase
VKGNARQVFSRGELVVESGRFLGTVGRGQYVHREVPRG